MSLYSFKTDIMRTVFIFLILSLAVGAAGQKVSLITEEDIGGITVTRSDTYERSGLYGYIDGGADLYLEYGFIKLYVNEYKWDGEDIRTEIWVMEDAPSAYGVYSLSHDYCLQWNSLSSFSCTSKYQVTACAGPLFISVTNASGSGKALEECSMMMREILRKNPQEIWYMPSMFQHPKLMKFTNSIRYFEGQLGLQNGIPVMYDLLENMEFNMYTILAGDSLRNASLITRLVFPDFESVQTFLARAQLNPINYSADPVQVSNNLYRSWYKVNDTKIIYMESMTDSIHLKDYIPKAKVPDWLSF